MLTNEIAYDILFLIIAGKLWFCRIKRLLVAVGGVECEGQIAGFICKGSSFSKLHGWGHRYTYTVMIGIDGKNILCETADDLFLSGDQKPHEPGGEVDVIYNRKRDKCLMSSFLREGVCTAVLLAVSVLPAAALVHDIMLVMR